MTLSVPVAFKVYAEAVVRGAGFDRATAAGVRDEIIEHLATRWEADLAAGAAPATAIDRSLSTFGAPDAIQRRFLLARLRGSVVRAITLPRALLAFIAFDVTIGLLWFAVYLTELRLGTLDLISTEVVASLVWVLMLIASWALLRVGWRLVADRARTPAGMVEALAGAGIALFALGQVFAHEPSVVAMVASRLMPHPPVWRAVWSDVAWVGAFVALGSAILRAFLARRLWLAQ